MVPGPRLGWAYARSVAEPLGLQLLDAARPAPGSRVAILLDDHDLLGEALRLRGAEPVDWDGTGSPPPADAVLSLLTLGFADMAHVLRASRDALPGGGIAAHVVFDAALPPLAEQVLDGAVRQLGLLCPHLGRLVPEGVARAARRAGYACAALRDVARFDGPAQLWEALVEEHALGHDLAVLADETIATLRARLLSGLAEHTVADGTLRIPVTATLLRASR